MTAILGIILEAEQIITKDVNILIEHPAIYPPDVYPEVIVPGPRGNEAWDKISIL